MPHKRISGRGYPSLSLGLFVAVCVGCGSLIGIIFRPPGWVPMADGAPILPAAWLLPTGWLIYFVALAILGHGIWQKTQGLKVWRWVFGGWCAHALIMGSLAPLIFVAHLLPLVEYLLVICILMIMAIGLRIAQKEPRLMRYVVVVGAWDLFILYLTSKVMAMF